MKGVNINKYQTAFDCPRHDLSGQQSPTLILDHNTSIFECSDCGYFGTFEYIFKEK